MSGQRIEALLIGMLITASLLLAFSFIAGA